MSNKILILFAHPSQHRSEINVPLFRASGKYPFVTCIDLYREYPTLRIDINREQQRLIEHDVIVFMFPLYWYSTPAILKEWQDLVLEYGFAYGHDGKALHGKSFFCAISAGGSEQAYRHEGMNHFTMRELLQPLEQTAMLTGMTYLAPFTLFAARTANDDGRIQRHIAQWEALLESIHNNSLDKDKAQACAVLNECVSTPSVDGTVAASSTVAADGIEGVEGKPL